VTKRTWAGTLLFSLIVAAYLAAIASLVGRDGWNDGWRAFGVPAIAPGFTDGEVVLLGLDCWREGYPPEIADPCPRLGHRRMNYPKLWMALAPTGLGTSDRAGFGYALSGIFFVAVLALVARARPTIPGALVAAAAVLSPVVLMCVERGNTDLVVFALLTAGALLVGSSRATRQLGGLATIGVAATLKLFPAAALAVAALRRDRLVRRGGLAVFAAFVAYCALTANDLRRVSAVTPRPRVMAFGANVLPFRVIVGVRRDVTGDMPEPRLRELMRPAALAGGALFMAVVVASFAAGRRRPLAVDLGGWRGIAFAAGGLAYLGAFALGNNWDHRLVVLILLLPLLLEWCEGERRLRRIGWISLGAILGAMWLSLDDAMIAWPMDELLHWALVGIVAYVLTSGLATPTTERGLRG
jgi:hypothetical protein